MRKGNGFLLLGLLLLAGAAGLAFYNMQESQSAGQQSGQVLQQMLTAATEPTPAQTEETVPQPIPEFMKPDDRPMPETAIEGRNYVGVLTLPQLELELPILADLTDDGLQIAPCRYHGTAYTGNFVIAAHNYASHFGYLRQLSPGDTIYFTDMDNTTFAYTVAALEVIEPYDVEGMLNAPYDLTLFTCTTGGQRRITLRADKAE